MVQDMKSKNYKHFEVKMYYFQVAEKVPVKSFHSQKY